MKKTNTLCYVLALCLLACHATHKIIQLKNSSIFNSENQDNNNTDAKVLRMQLSSIKDNQVTKGDAVFFIATRLATTIANWIGTPKTHNFRQVVICM
jgi:hypothetical protein